MKELPFTVRTIFSSVAAATFRMALTPTDTIKTTVQTQGKPGVVILKARVRGLLCGSTLFNLIITQVKQLAPSGTYGALATAAAAFVGHYPVLSTSFTDGMFSSNQTL